MRHGWPSSLMRSLAVVAVAAAVLTAAVAWLNVRGEAPLEARAMPPSTPELVARGAYLARAGNCMGCHTAAGGAPYAGGRGVPTPFGTVYSTNLTPDLATGLGAWTAGEFWRALHHGRSRDGRLLYPAFPYPNYTRVRRDDADAIHAYLRSLPAVAQANPAHALTFPFDRQAALAVWRALYFRPDDSASQSAPTEPGRTAEWQRGAYLVEGLGHCNACHASRNALGATASTLDLAGGLIPVQNWYAPSLLSPREAGVAGWDPADVVALLRDGVSKRGSVLGPMSEVVSGSTQHLSEPDLRAMVAYLQALPQTPPEAPTASAPLQTPVSPPSEPRSPDAATLDGPGARLYEHHCAQCHGAQGEGVAGIYPALAGNRAVTMRTPANLVHVVLEGGFPPSTGGNPRPFGMPPYATELADAEVAQLLSHLRSHWGNRAAPVSELDVARFRSVR